MVKEKILETREARGLLGKSPPTTQGFLQLDRRRPFAKSGLSKEERWSGKLVQRQTGISDAAKALVMEEIWLRELLDLFRPGSLQR